MRLLPDLKLQRSKHLVTMPRLPCLCSQRLPFKSCDEYISTQCRVHGHRTRRPAPRPALSAAN